jgi:hypothetical protein
VHSCGCYPDVTREDFKGALFELSVGRSGEI